MTADTTRREHSGSGIRLGIGSCPGIAKILPAGIRGITLPTAHACACCAA